MQATHFRPLVFASLVLLTAFGTPASAQTSDTAALTVGAMERVAPDIRSSRPLSEQSSSPFVQWQAPTRELVVQWSRWLSDGVTAGRTLGVAYALNLSNEAAIEAGLEAGVAGAPSAFGSVQLRLVFPGAAIPGTYLSVGYGYGLGSSRVGRSGAGMLGAGFLIRLTDTVAQRLEAQIIDFGGGYGVPWRLSASLMIGRK